MWSSKTDDNAHWTTVQLYRGLTTVIDANDTGRQLDVFNTDTVAWEIRVNSGAPQLLPVSSHRTLPFGMQETHTNPLIEIRPLVDGTGDATQVRIDMV